MGSSKPALVIVIRHGEKPGNPAQDQKGGPHLSIAGSARAAALPSLFTPDPGGVKKGTQKQLECKISSAQTGRFKADYKPSALTAGKPRFAVPAYLLASKPSPSSNRPVETITPLAQALNLPIAARHADKNYGKLANQILNSPATYGGKVILVCWHHGKIPKLIAALGVPAVQLKPWQHLDPAVFDLIFQITWNESGQANLNVGHQELLFGDTAEPHTESKQLAAASIT
jgi:hypothetical protein